MTCPICTNELVWVDNGPKLRYHYCRVCKLELGDLRIKQQQQEDASTNHDVKIDNWDPTSYYS